MENRTENRNDVLEFFEKMPSELQQVAIRKLMKQKKPPDFPKLDAARQTVPESEGDPAIS
ncbi:hypothetical protein [Enterococcus olivae]